jgi:hypothetical protein
MSLGNISAVGIFCSDIREEVGNQFSVIGILPDNLNVGAVGAAMLPHLSVYARIVMQPGAVPKSMRFYLRLSWQDDPLDLGPVDITALTRDAHTEFERGTPLFTIISRAQAAPFPIMVPGQIICLADIDGVETPICFLRIASNLPQAAEEPRAPPKKRRKQVSKGRSAT